ncbi:hypothetical protein ABNG03_10750 [Halorubrum sp. RMP-47]|uniref:Cell surface protein n=1 Tax=Halorubrum miltondacostae TaxID=3076378 RepID=A0ABD5M492_9EURY
MNKTFAVICALVVVFASISAGVSVAMLSDKESVSLGFSADVPAPDPVVLGDNMTESVNASIDEVTSIEKVSENGPVTTTTNGMADPPAPDSNESLGSGPPDRNDDGANRNATGDEQVSDLPAPGESTNSTNTSATLSGSTTDESLTDDGQTSPSDQNSTPSEESNDTHSGTEANQLSDSDSHNPPSSDAGDDSKAADTSDGEAADTSDGEAADNDTGSDSDGANIGSGSDDINDPSDGADSTDQ